MNFLRLSLTLLIAAWSVNGLAANLPFANQDCREILEHWASQPKSVPKRLVDACKDQLAAAPAEPAAAAQPVVSAAPAVTDPCTGPNAADSVLCWGPWASIAPAASGPAEVAADIPRMPGSCEAGSQPADRCVPQLEPGLIVSACSAGAPCGFATVVAGVTSGADVEHTTFANFDLAADGSNFTVDPAGPNEIKSVNGMTTIVTPREDGYENMRASGQTGDEQSRLVARVVRNDGGDIQLAADIWGHGNRATGDAHSGYFAWGTATSQAGLDSLNGGNVSVNFAGPMSVDNNTSAAMTVNFGTQPTWSGTWTNPGYSFGAGGQVSGVNLISSPAQFSANVVRDGSFVQGAVLGELGHQALAHIIDVTLTDAQHIKDVGLLRPVPADPGGGVIIIRKP